MKEEQKEQKEQKNSKEETEKKPLDPNWAHEASNELKEYIEEQGIQIRY